MAIEEPVTTVLPTFQWEACEDQASAPGTVINQDGIIKPKIRFIDSFDNGRLQSILVPPGFVPNNTGRYFISEGQWDYFSTGGRQGGGYIRSIANTFADQGQYNVFNRETPTAGNGMVGDPTPNKGGIFTGICLFGQAVPSQGLAVHGYHADITGKPHLTVNINIDRTVSAIAFGVPNITLQTSVITVPVNGWFALESQLFLNDVGNLASGFILVKLYTQTNPAGDYIITQKGVKTRNGTQNIFADAYGTQAWKGTGAGVGISGVGFDDIILYNGNGTRRKFLADSYTASILANDIGSNNESQIDFIDEFNNHPIHGDAIRWKNVNQIDAHREPSNASGVGFIGANFNGDCSAVLTFTRSSFSGAWLTTVPFYANPTIFNHFTTEAIDTYKLSAPRNDIVDILAVSPFVMIGSCWTTWSDGFGGNGVLSGLHATGNNLNRVYHPIIKRGLTLWSGKASIAAESTFKPQMGFGIAERDILEIDPSTSVAWLPSALVPGAIEAGVKGDNSFSPASPFGIWNEFDLQLVGLEYAYHIANVIESETPPVAPIAHFSETGTGLGPYHFVDASVDWDGNIVTWHWDFGDGNTSALQNPVDHTYLTTGDKTVSLTVTDDDGLTSIYSVTLAIPNNPPVANFSVAANPGDITNKTVDFTDLSTDVGGTIVSWEWDFGDGTLPHSFVRNPTHVYAVPGTPLVTLKVTDNNGATDLFTAEVDIPIGGGGGDCTLSANALADVAYVMGDDYNGGNAPLPAYLNTASYDAYYLQSNPRDAYIDHYDTILDGVSHFIDGTHTFNGHKTLAQTFGNSPAPSGHPHYDGGGWDTTPSDDGHPVETVYPSAPFGPGKFWLRRIFKADAGIIPSGSLLTSQMHRGLMIFDASGSSIDAGLWIRGGRINLDYTTRLTLGGSNFSSTADVCNENIFVGRGDALYGELIARLSVDNVAHTLNMKVWAGTACTLVGVSPLVNLTVNAFPLSGTTPLGFNFIENWLPDFVQQTMTNKQLNLALWEQEDEVLTSNTNPYGVSLT